MFVLRNLAYSNHLASYRLLMCLRLVYMRILWRSENKWSFLEEQSLPPSRICLPWLSLRCVELSFTDLVAMRNLVTSTHPPVGSRSALRGAAKSVSCRRIPSPTGITTRSPQTLFPTPSSPSLSLMLPPSLLGRRSAAAGRSDPSRCLCRCCSRWS